MSVTLQYALNRCENVVYIGSRLSKQETYLCPHCKEEVIARKGQVNAHHFAHKPQSSCSVTAETLLHYEAKHYLADCVNALCEGKEDKDVLFNIDVTRLDKRYRGLFDALGVKLYNLSLSELVRTYRRNAAKVEARYGVYIADVLLVNYASKEVPFVFEIYVTHENSKDKEAFYLTTKLPYMEVIPTRVGSEFHFEVNRMSISKQEEVIYERLQGAVVSTAYTSFRKELLEIAREEVTEEETRRVREELREEVQKEVTEADKRKLKKEVTDYILNDMQVEEAEDFLLRKLQGNASVVDGQVYMSDVMEIEQLETFAYKTSHKTGKETKHLLVNDRYFVNNEQNLLFSLIQELRRHCGVEVLIGQKGKSVRKVVVGFRLHVPNTEQVVQMFHATVGAMLRGEHLEDDPKVRLVVYGIQNHKDGYVDYIVRESKVKKVLERLLNSGLTYDGVEVLDVRDLRSVETWYSG